MTFGLYATSDSFREADQEFCHMHHFIDGFHMMAITRDSSEHVSSMFRFELQLDTRTLVFVKKELDGPDFWSLISEWEDERREMSLEFVKRERCREDQEAKLWMNMLGEIKPMPMNWSKEAFLSLFIKTRNVGWDKAVLAESMLRRGACHNACWLTNSEGVELDMARVNRNMNFPGSWKNYELDDEWKNNVETMATLPKAMCLIEIPGRVARGEQVQVLSNPRVEGECLVSIETAAGEIFEMFRERLEVLP